MIKLDGEKFGQHKQLPPFLTADEVLLDSLPLLDPPSRITVTDAAERHMMVQKQGSWQKFDRNETPYMVEPSDITQSRRFKSVALIGPSQSGKTMALQTTAGHAITVNQRDVLLIHMTQSDRDKWVEQKLDPIVQNSPDLLSRLGTAREDDTFSRKRFKGMRLFLGYPTPTALSGGSYALVLLTDFDHFPQKLGGTKDQAEATTFGMALARIKSFMSRGCVLVESSPGFAVEDLDWEPSVLHPHEFPPVSAGIVPIYNRGTRGRFYWQCRDCGGEFEPRIDRLVYDESLSPGDAGDAAEMECPHCGSLISHRFKTEFNRATLKDVGGWRHEGDDGQVYHIDDLNVRKSIIASYALNGAVARFSTWSEIVSKLEEAKRVAIATGDEIELAGVNFTDIGIPHRSIRAKKAGQISTQFLRDFGHELPKGIAPSWTRFITIAVDVQNTYFAVQVVAWGDDGQGQVVDRYELATPPESASDFEQRKLDPAKHFEDWDVLKPLREAPIPVEGGEYGLKPVAVAVDFHGAPGVSDNAESFWKERVEEGQQQSWFMCRGHGGWKVPGRVWYEAPERKSGGGEARKIMLLNIGSDRLKDTLSASLLKADGASGAMLLPRWMGDDQLGEFIAEERQSRGWKPKKGVVRNEGTDLSVMARAVAEFKCQGAIPPKVEKNWTQIGIGNLMAVAIGGQSTIGTEAITGSKQKTRPRRARQISYLER